MIAPTTYPGLGISANVPLSDYLALRAVSSGALRDLGRSPAYCHWREANPSEATAAMTLGSLVDAILLEPGTVAARFARKDFDARTTVGKARRDELAAAGIEVLSLDDYQRAEDTAAAVLSHGWFDSIDDVRRQMTVVWGDPATGLVCKGRPDVIGTLAGRRVLVDLKVCRQAAQDQYPRMAVPLWHPQQLAWYERGLRQCGEEPFKDWYILAVHPEPPHEVTPYRISEALKAWARDTVHNRFGHYASCVEDGAWGPGEDMVTVDLPAYLMDHEVQVEDGEEVGHDD